jgi:protein-S-isoprenylcysteine O-methyltransferase Ste14
MYGGLILATLGLAAVTKDETRVALAALLWFIFERKTALEEKELLARYPLYEEYRSKVKKYIPFIY